MRILKQGNFWGIILVLGLDALLSWLIYVGYVAWKDVANTGFETWEYALVIVGIVLFLGFTFYQIYKMFKKIRW